MLYVTIKVGIVVDEMESAEVFAEELKKDFASKNILADVEIMEDVEIG